MTEQHFFRTRKETVRSIHDLDITNTLFKIVICYFCIETGSKANRWSLIS